MLPHHYTGLFFQSAKGQACRAQNYLWMYWTPKIHWPIIWYGRSCWKTRLSKVFSSKFHFESVKYDFSTLQKEIIVKNKSILETFIQNKHREVNNGLILQATRDTVTQILLRIGLKYNFYDYYIIYEIFRNQNKDYFWT